MSAGNRLNRSQILQVLWTKNPTDAFSGETTVLPSMTRIGISPGIGIGGLVGSRPRPEVIVTYPATSSKAKDVWILLASLGEKHYIT